MVSFPPDLDRQNAPKSAAQLARFGIGLGLGFAGPVAVTFDGDHVGVMNDAIDERSGASGVGEPSIDLRFLSGERTEAEKCLPDGHGSDQSDVTPQREDAACVAAAAEHL
jgi:hypothetical protein